jgi:signal peptidase I
MDDLAIVDQVKQGRVEAFRLLVEKYNRSLLQFIFHLYPHDRSKVYMKRIVGLPGDVVERQDGGRETVPNRQVYVLGNNTDHSVDSRTFGTVPLWEVIGEVRQVYFSSSAEGIRWFRIGMVVNR